MLNIIKYPIMPCIQLSTDVLTWTLQQTTTIRQLGRNIIDLGKFLMHLLLRIMLSSMSLQLAMFLERVSRTALVV